MLMARAGISEGSEISGRLVRLVRWVKALARDMVRIVEENDRLNNVFVKLDARVPVRSKLICRKSVTG